MTDPRPAPPYEAGERDTTVGFLDFLRATIVRKCEGLTEEQLRSTPTFSAMTLLGLVRHLTMVERYWFQGVFLDADVEFWWSQEEPDGEWIVPADVTAADVLAAYKAECQISNRIVGEYPLETPSKYAPSDDERASLRWIVVHMVEETARHAGHADLLREAIDGVTGE
ncbi:MAG TPA: DinB family protein [Tessaracoccus flavescens]|uniref:DinB family protein n=1 Tax=Tessaracoccus flavescens TaxID=399497 RepID=A0A921EQP6_9ACTN|nr:DinB family protein [Tessaracoccus flavescens]